MKFLYSKVKVTFLWFQMFMFVYGSLKEAIRAVNSELSNGPCEAKENLGISRYYEVVHGPIVFTSSLNFLILFAEVLREDA